MTALSLKSVSYAYEDATAALEGVSMELGEGECVAILGPNGAGKSTLLKLMTRLLEPTSGVVETGGKGVGIIFQDPDDQIFMPRVWDDIAFGPINLGLDRAEVERRVEKAMGTAGLAGYEERVPHHLSYGERKRVAIAGVLAMEPDILLLDEPTANLDPRGRRAIMEFIGGLGISVVLATHDIEAAAEMADRIYVLDRKVLAQGTSRDILTDAKLLESAGLEMPQVARVFAELKARGRYSGEIPLTVGEATGKG
jgi:cobalt/nickel transport system ATP-binding protein